MTDEKKKESISDKEAMEMMELFYHTIQGLLVFYPGLKIFMFMAFEDTAITGVCVNTCPHCCIDAIVEWGERNNIQHGDPANIGMQVDEKETKH